MQNYYFFNMPMDVELSKSSVISMTTTLCHSSSIKMYEHNPFSWGHKDTPAPFSPNMPYALPHSMLHVNFSPHGCTSSICKEPRYPEKKISNDPLQHP